MTDSRTMTLSRPIKAPLATVWAAWADPAALPQWWGPDGFSCRTTGIELRTGGDWVFDMIGPDGTIYPNHHHFERITPRQRVDYTLHWGENGPKHADASIRFKALVTDQTTVTLSMTFATQAEHDQAIGFDAPALGLQTLGKLARFIGAP